MRLYLIVPALLITLACGSSKLSPREAAEDIKKEYPVSVNVKIPESESAIKGSPEHAKLVLMQEQLTRNGWFTATRNTEGDRERFSFKLGPKSTPEVHTAPKGWEIPAAKAEFVKVTGIRPTQDGAKVAYQIRLVKPSINFDLFKALHPNVRIGETKERFAVYRKDGRSWIFQSTDEKFKKAE